MIRKDWKKRRKLTRDEFAKKCGVSKMAISKAVGKGSVIEDDAGHVDVTNPVNRAYLLADHAVMRRARARAPKDEKVSRAAASKLAAKRAQEKHDQWMAEHAAKTAEMETRRAKTLGILAEQKVMKNAMALFALACKIQITDRMHAMVPTLWAKFEQGKPIEEAFQHVNKETEEALKALIESAQSVKLTDT